MLFNKKKDEKVVASAPTPKVEPSKIEKKKAPKCKFHKEHKRHCVDCEKF